MAPQCPRTKCKPLQLVFKALVTWPRLPPQPHHPRPPILLPPSTLSYGGPINLPKFPAPPPRPQASALCCSSCLEYPLFLVNSQPLLESNLNPQPGLNALHELGPVSFSIPSSQLLPLAHCAPATLALFQAPKQAFPAPGPLHQLVPLSSLHSDLPVDDSFSLSIFCLHIPPSQKGLS